VVSAFKAASYQGERGGSEQAAPPGAIDNAGPRVGEGTQGKTVRDGCKQVGAIIERDPRPELEPASSQEILIEVFP
jgi:hypothetical protein